jgi:hypothetical protein
LDIRTFFDAGQPVAEQISTDVRAGQSRARFRRGTNSVVIFAMMNKRCESAAITCSLSSV